MCSLRVVTPCSSERGRRFEEQLLNFQDRRGIAARNEQESGDKQYCFQTWGLLFDPEDGSNVIFRNAWLSPELKRP
jgi:hypothetical protein